MGSRVAWDRRHVGHVCPTIPGTKKRRLEAVRNSEEVRERVEAVGDYLGELDEGLTE